MANSPRFDDAVLFPGVGYDPKRLLLGDMVVGVLGAILGGFMASVTLGLDISGIDWTSLLVAAVGAAILIVVLNALPATEIYD